MRSKTPWRQLAAVAAAPLRSGPNPILQLIARASKGGPTLLELIARSPQPIRFGERSRSEEFLDALFPGDALLSLGKSKSKVSTVPREVARGFAASQSLIVPSPMSSKEGRNKKGGISARCEANTGPRRFLIVEFDHTTLDQQAALLWHLANYAPLALIVFSGSRSTHGWFFCRGQSEDKLERFFDYAVSLGADSALWSRCQLCRMPDGRRYDGKTGEALVAAGVTGAQVGRQAVLFFNPEVIR